ncbi:uncharacterized protein LOC131003838 isoform X3 [Salvia miltiorrhiza]|uniref:uncharacterized protein LOC131003838 isoform X3 n=1 Tax=Salvia miltiorrhiza TaxID=226208 RepID=UPI0025AC6B59|nr:uncharacterized protein LOC131003838 isoform X3 [Salvia miltiorrhiza]
MAQIRDVLHPWLQQIWEVLHPWLHPTLQIHDSSSWQAIPLQVGFRNCREREKLQVILRPWSKNGALTETVKQSQEDTLFARVMLL